MSKNKKLVIVGDGEFAEIAHEYFTYDSDYEVVAFAVEKEFGRHCTLFNKPVIALENIEKIYPKEEYVLFTAITFTKFNTVRMRIYNMLKQKGYSFATYISNRAFVWRNVKIGENTFIFEDNTIQYNVTIGNGVILWSGNHVGHSAKIEDYCFISSHVVISGYCNVGQGSFIGVNTAIGDKVNIAKNTFIGAGTVITKSIIEEGKMYVGNPGKPLTKTAYEHFNIE